MSLQHLDKNQGVRHAVVLDAVNVSIEAEDLLEGVRKGKLVQLVGRVPAAGHERPINVCDATSVDIVVHTRT